MKILAIAMIFIGIIVGIGDIVNEVYGNYYYSKQFESYWNLADKASTIKQKSEYINLFVDALKSSGLQGEYNAIFMKTPDNSFDRNLEALESLQSRLNEIQTMDISSFQYQSAIQQITAQEQADAQDMLDVFSGIWWKENHFWLWDWVGSIQILSVLLVFFIGLVILAKSGNLSNVVFRSKKF